MNAVEINFVVDTIGIFIFANIESQFARNAFLLCNWHHISVVLLVSFRFLCNLDFFKYICCVLLFNSCDPFYSFVLRGGEVLFEFRPCYDRFQFKRALFFQSIIHLSTHFSLTYFIFWLILITLAECTILFYYFYPFDLAHKYKEKEWNELNKASESHFYCLIEIIKWNYCNRLLKVYIFVCIFIVLYTNWMVTLFHSSYSDRFHIHSIRRIYVCVGCKFFLFNFYLLFFFQWIL